MKKIYLINVKIHCQPYSFRLQRAFQTKVQHQFTSQEMHPDIVPGAFMTSLFPLPVLIVVDRNGIVY